MSLEAGFSVPTRTWFEATFDTATPVQQRGWQEIHAGHHALLVAPTGSGKTLAAFLAGIDHCLNLPADAATNLADALALDGYDLAPGGPVPGGELAVTLYWQPLRGLDREYHSFVHLVGAGGETVLLADAYAAQHPGVPGPQAIQSVAIHLLVLEGVFNRGVAPENAQWVRRRALRISIQAFDQAVIRGPNRGVGHAS